MCPKCRKYDGTSMTGASYFCVTRTSKSLLPAMSAPSHPPSCSCHHPWFWTSQSLWSWSPHRQCRSLEGYYLDRAKKGFRGNKSAYSQVYISALKNLTAAMTQVWSNISALRLNCCIPKLNFLLFKGLSKSVDLTWDWFIGTISECKKKYKISCNLQICVSL